MFRRLFSILMIITTICVAAVAQEDSVKGYHFTMIKSIDCSPVNNQERAGTCWSYSAIGVVESEMLRMGKPYVNLSELYVVRKMYEEKAKNYIRMHGEYNFGGGGAINDVFHCIKAYGAMPEILYTGLNYGSDVHTHGELEEVLKSYLDAVIENKNMQLTTAWYNGFLGILDAYLGKVPETFEWEGKTYTPRTFADDVVGINPDDYYYFTSFTHHPFYEKFVLEVPDNWTWTRYMNLPLDVLMAIIDHSIESGYAVVWASDVSERGFSSTNGLAIVPEDEIAEMTGEERLKWEAMDEKERKNILYSFKSPVHEKVINQDIRQQAFDNYETTDDHGMVIAGIAKDQNGTKYYYIKNSWGTTYNKYGGYFYASESFVRYKTLSIAINKEALPKDLRKKLDIK